MMLQKLIGIVDQSHRLNFLFYFRILLSYGDNGEVILRGKGTGGLPEMKRKLHDNQIYVGVIRVRAVDDHGSRRAKFVFINYVGTNVVSPSMRFTFLRYSFLLANITCCTCIDT